MKHVSVNSKWSYITEPFPQFSCGLVFGRNKRDHGFIPCNIAPEEVDIPLDPFCRIRMTNVKLVLPEGKFRVIKTKEKGTIMIVPGEDKTDRVLLFCGEEGGFRGSCGVVEKETTGNILKIVQASNNCQSEVQAIVILSPGEKIVFFSYGRRNDDIIVYEYTNGEVKRKSFSKEQYEAFSSPKEEVEVL